MASTVRSHKGLVTKKNQIVLAWLEESSQFLQTVRQTSTQHEHSKELALAVSTCDEYLQLLEVSLTKLTEAFDKLEDTTDEDEEKIDKYIESVEETIVELHAHRSNLKKTLQEDDTGSMHGSSGPNDHSSVAANKLPVIPIPTFTGRKWEWDNFWALYKANVHDQDLSQLQKFNYLLTSLSGEAKQSIARFYVSANNYDKAIQHLIKRYGNKEGIVLELNKSLHNCVARGPSTMEQRQLWGELSTIAAQLEEHDEHLSNQITIQIFLQKFHTRIRKAAMERRLRHQEEHQSEWTLDQWLDAIDAIISHEEQLNHMLTVDGQSTSPPLQNATTTKTFPDSESDGKLEILCECCGRSGHRWTFCPAIPTAAQRRTFLLDSSRCLNCGSANHRVASCSSGNCKKCHRRHNTAICTESMPREPKSSGKSKQRAVTRDTKEEVTQGTFPIDEGASRTFGPEVATTLLLRRRHTVSSSLPSPSNSDATAKTTSSEDNSAKDRTKRQATSNVSLHSLEPHNAEPLTKKALVTATSAAIAATTTSLFSSSSSDTDTIFPTSPAKSPANLTASKTRILSSDNEGTTMHSSWKNLDTQTQHQELRDWMQSMEQHFETLKREMEKRFETLQEKVKKQHKEQGVNIHAEHHALQRTMQLKNEVKGRNVKIRRHREISPTTSQTRSNTASSLQKEISSKKRRRNIASPSGKTQKRKERRLNFLDDQRRQAPALGKNEESQRRFKVKRSVNRSGQAGVYELRSHHPTRPSERGAKHSNVSDSSDVRHRQNHKHAQRSPKNSTVNKTGKILTRKGEPRHRTSDNAPTFLLGEQILEETTENAIHSTEFRSEIARREIKWNHITPYAPWQGGFYERLIRSIKTSLYKSFGVRTITFDGLKTMLTEIEAMLNSRPLTYQEVQQSLTAFTEEWRRQRESRHMDVTAANIQEEISQLKREVEQQHEHIREWIEEAYDQAAKQMLIERQECTKDMKAELDSQLGQLQQKISCLEQQLLGLGAQFKEETERRGRENSEFLNQLMDEISKEGPGHRREVLPEDRRDHRRTHSREVMPEDRRRDHRRSQSREEVLREDQREHRRSRSREQVSPENRRRERKRSHSTVGSRTRKESFNDRREHHQGEGRKRKHSERKTDRRQHYEELLASYEEELEKTRTELRQISCPTRRIGDGGLKTGQNIMCIFCKEFGQHYSDGCPRIISITDRIAILDNEGRCHRCLERHLNACPRQTSCFYCKNVGRSTDYDHHAGICPLPDEMDRLRSRQRELEESVQNYRRELQLITHDRSTAPMEDYPGPSHS